MTRKLDVVIVDDWESEFAISLLNGTIPTLNLRERRSAPEWLGLLSDIGGIEFISGTGYRVCFRHLDSGRVYGIVAPGYEPYVTRPPMSCRRVPLDPKLVKRVERLVCLEKQPNGKHTREHSLTQSAP